MREILTTAVAPFGSKIIVLGWVVVRPELRGVQKNPQDLWVCHGGPARQKVESGKHQKPAQESTEQIEGSGTHDQGQKEQPALGSCDGEGLIQRPVDRMQGGYI
jgi:hypothetical protein